MMMIAPIHRSCMLCLAVLLLPNTVNSHAQGLHGLSGDEPSGAPDLPAITAAFEVEMNVRFNGFLGTLTNPYATLFHFYTGDNENQGFSIWFGHRNWKLVAGQASDRTYLEVRENGSQYICTVDDYNVNIGEFYNFKFSVDQSGAAKIERNGLLLMECSGFPVPSGSTTKHYLGLSPIYDPGTNAYATENHLGAISGVRITNAQQNHPRELFKYMNFPGQVLSSFGSGFVASFYARFDDLSRSNQAVFDFGNSGPSDNIFCGQLGSSSTLRCGVFQGGNEYSLSLANALVEGEFAFFHFSVTDTGEASLQKDTDAPFTQSLGIVPTSIFRRQTVFCDSNWIADDDLDGVVVEFRLDPTRTS